MTSTRLTLEGNPWSITEGLKRTAPVLGLGVLFERSAALCFQHPLFSLSGLGITYYFRSKLQNEITLIGSEARDTSRLNNFVRFVLPWLCVTTPLLTLKATQAGENLTYLMISTLFATSVSAISPIARLHMEKIDLFFLDRIGMHASNLATRDRFSDIDSIDKSLIETGAERQRELQREIEKIEGELKEKGVYVSGDSIVVISEVEEKK